MGLRLIDCASSAVGAPGILQGYWTVSWRVMEWDGPPAESAAVTVMVWIPLGVPVF